MNKMISLFVVSALAIGSADACCGSPTPVFSVTLPVGSGIVCGTPWVNNVVATSIDNNGTVHGQIEYVGYANVGSGRGGTRVVYSYMIYNATWDSTGTLVATVNITKSCTTGNYLVGTFAVPNNQSYLHTYTNGYNTVVSQYANPGNPPRMRWIATLSAQ